MSETTDIAVREATGSGGIAELVRQMLLQLGEDPNREGLRRTPERFEKALRYLTSGYGQDPEKLLNGAMFSVCYDEMVVVKDIEVYSLCEHHLLPFFGKCHVAYIPNKKVVGLSKIARLVNMYARRLQIQERLTSQIASVHGDARSGKAALRGGDQCDVGRVPREQADARRIPVAGSKREVARAPATGAAVKSLCGLQALC
jgi:GTP cyclohydrolase I